MCGGSVTAGLEAVNAACISALTVAFPSMVPAVGADRPSSSTTFAKSFAAKTPCMFLKRVWSANAAARSAAGAASILVLYVRYVLLLAVTNA